MASNQQISVSLPEHMLEFVQRKVNSGQYPDQSAVIADSLSFLEDEEQYFERWLREEVVPACLELEADPSKGLTVDEVRAELEAARARRAAASVHGA